MIKPSRIMLEINGSCSRGCPTCLPPVLRTNRQMTFDEIKLVAGQLVANDIVSVVFAGFGSPVDHPLFEDVTFLLASRMKRSVAVVCRPMDILRTEGVDAAVVSVGSQVDVELLFSKVKSEAWFGPPIAAHILLPARTREHLAFMLPALLSFPMVVNVTATVAMKLCEDGGHAAAIAAENSGVEETVNEFDRVVESLPDAQRTHAFAMLDNHFPEHCAFHADGGTIYVDADLKVRPCCHQPVAAPLGDLRQQTLAEVVKSPAYQDWAAGWKTWGPCTRCPDIGS